MGRLMSRLLAGELQAMSPEEQIEAIREFRGLATDAQRESIRGRTAWRSFEYVRDNGAIDEKARTAWLSIASDSPYERWWGVEVLDVKAGAIRDQRLKAGMALLVGHDSSDQVGVVDDYEITSDRKLRIKARFGRSARAEEVFRDVLDGIRRTSSVGYVIHDLVLEKQEGDVCTYRVTDWEPLEGSLVSIPADPTVGVGRALERRAPPTQRTLDMTPEEKAKLEAEIRAKVEAEMKAKAEEEARAAQNNPDAVAKREQERVSAILAAGDEFKEQGGPELARELIGERSASVDTFKARMFEKMRGSHKPSNTAKPAERQEFGKGARVLYKYRTLKAFKDLQCDDGTTMKAEEAAYRAGMWLAGTVYGKDWGQKWCREHGVPLMFRNLETGSVHERAWTETRVAGENVLSGGGALVPIELEAAIIMLRDVYGVARRLARIRPMSSDQLKIPRRKGGVQAFYFQDDDGAGVTASDKNWDQVTLSAKKLGALARLSKDLIEDAVISVADDMAQEQAYAFAVKEDNALINGDGTSTYGGIQGFIPKFQATAYQSRIALATGHHTFATVDNVDLTSVHAGVAQFARVAGPSWLCSGEFAASVFDRLKAVAGGNRVDTLGEAPNDQYLRYPITTSEAMPTGVTTDYTSKVMALFGRFDLACSFGIRRGIEIQTLVERYAELGQVGILCTERHDIVVHDLGTTNAADISGGRGPVAAAYGA